MNGVHCAMKINVRLSQKKLTFKKVFLMDCGLLMDVDWTMKKLNAEELTRKIKLQPNHIIHI